MDTVKNIEKYEIYKNMSGNLSKAMKAGFYYEAIFLEYAMFEDRFTSLLKHAGLPREKKGRPLKISQKLSTVRDHPTFTDKFVRERLTVELLDNIKAWIEERNSLIHNLANIPYDSQNVKSIAEDGERLLKIFKNKSASVINQFKKIAN